MNSCLFWNICPIVWGPFLVSSSLQSICWYPQSLGPHFVYLPWCYWSAVSQAFHMADIFPDWMGGLFHNSIRLVLHDMLVPLKLVGVNQVTFSAVGDMPILCLSISHMIKSSRSKNSLKDFHLHRRFFSYFLTLERHSAPWMATKCTMSYKCYGCLCLIYLING